MEGIKFFVEGDADVKFIGDYLVHLGISKSEISRLDFVIINGNTENLIEKKQVDFERSTDQENINLLIFDADLSSADTLERLNSIKSKLTISFETFLFPNNTDPGNLEVLLEKIINPIHLPIFQCFEQYQQCIGGKSAAYKVPARKTKIYAYVDTLVSEKDEKLAQEPKRDYLNRDHWDLNSVELKPLKDFLEAYIR